MQLKGETKEQITYKGAKQTCCTWKAKVVEQSSVNQREYATHYVSA
jgi:hypothetical protein